MRTALIALAIAVCLDSGAVFPRPRLATDTHIEHIIGMAMGRGGAYAFLQHLTDTIGGRVSGTPESRATADLLLTALREAGFENAHFEEYAIASPWQRGPSAGRVASPVTRPLAVGSYGWAPGTDGEVSVPLVDLGTPAGSDIAVADRVRAAAVIVEPHAAAGAPAQVVRATLARALAAAGAAAMLIPSDKPNRLLYTSAYGFYPRAPLPVLSVAREDVLFLRRLLAGIPRIEVGADEHYLAGCRPRDLGDDVALLRRGRRERIDHVQRHANGAAHQGAQDNGVGVAAILEAATILKSIAITPRRTIRFVFFSGEEQGLLGSRAYIDRHRNELDGLRAVLIMDSGAQTPRGFLIHGRRDVERAATTILAPLTSLGASAVSLEASFDMDHGSFLAAGIPVFTLWVDEGDYDIHHHAASDTFDKVDARMLGLDTAVMAVAALQFANAPQPPGPRLSAAEATHLLENLGLESLRRAVYGRAEVR